MQHRTIFLGLSGGVDSAVSAALLQRRGERVVGVFLESWSESLAPAACEQTADRRDAARAAAHLHLPFLVLPCAELYRERVLAFFLHELRAGRTPNPDVECNASIKFEVFRDVSRAAGADAIATGHYARVEKKSGRVVLKKGVDPSKDQSYFLSRVAPSALSDAEFPVGGLRKNAVRTLAKSLRLPNAAKPDSQGLCFVGKIALPQFLRHFFAPTPGPIQTADGQRIGEHTGLSQFTIGQRRGTHVATGAPTYVVAKHVQANTLVVSSRATDLERSQVQADSWRWFGDPISTGLTAKLRYRQPDQAVTSIAVRGARADVRFARPQRAVTPGQVLVVYEGDRLAGSGILV